MPTDTYGLTVNGVDLQTYAFNIKNRGGRWHIPGKRGANPELPGVHGALWTPGKPYSSNSIVLTMWAIGADTNGTVPAWPGPRTLMESNIDMLGRLFAAPQVVLVQGRVDGSRTLTGEVVQAIDFSSMAGGTRAEFGVEIVAPDPFWYATGTTTQTIFPGSGVTNQIVTLTQFAGITGPLIKATYEITGPAQNPSLTDPVTGQWVKYGGTLAAGQVLTINSSTWTATVNGTNVIAQVAHGRGATFLDLSPEPAGPRIQFKADGGVTGATSVKVTARKVYLSA